VAAQGTVEAHLLDDQRIPVAAPSLIHKMGGSSRGTTAMVGWPLLHDECDVGWRQWFSQVGRPDIDSVSGSNFSDHALMIDAAADGHGVALASAVGADPHLRSGALVELEGPRIPRDAYRIYCDVRSYDDRQVRRVYEWVIREAARAPQAMLGMVCGADA
jgi:LysR family transcriptional regulator, glycine cleavage system transcriptional activator